MWPVRALPKKRSPLRRSVTAIAATLSLGCLAVFLFLQGMRAILSGRGVDMYWTLDGLRTYPASSLGLVIVLAAIGLVALVARPLDAWWRGRRH